MSNHKVELQRAYKKKVVDKLSKTVRAVALVVDAELVRMTPVDTGRARSNWTPSLNAPDRRTLEPNQKVDMSSVIVNFNIDDSILITNNLPYIRRLNDGYSRQAPAGFVEAAVAKGKRAIK